MIIKVSWRFCDINYSDSSLDLGWSKAHGFFIIMGGFHLFKRGRTQETSNVKPISHEDDTPLHPLAAIHLYGDNTLDIDFSSFSVPTEAEIEDRGKSDWLAKSLVLLQTSWFVMQCIARAVEHLPITHLEIVTLAYAAMNFVIYFFWLNKPLNVNRPVRVFRNVDVEEPISDEPSLPWEVILNNLTRLAYFSGPVRDNNIDLTRRNKVPMFWANNTENNALNANLVMLGVGVCFGAIHCIAWGFPFPTHAELLIWRVSSVAITAIPVFFSLMGPLSLWAKNRNFDTAALIIGITFIVAFGLYSYGRIFTLALALTSLRKLPPGAFDTVHWTTFLPHI